MPSDKQKVQMKVLKIVNVKTDIQLIFKDQYNDKKT